MKKNIKGITLVALVITIVILLILAGVAIAQLTENGLFEKVKLAKQKYTIAETKEKLELKITELRIEEEGKGETLTKEDLSKLNSDEIDVGSVENFPVEVIYGKYKFNVEENFVVTYVGEANQTTITYTTEPEGYTNQDEIQILIKVSNPNGIKSIEYPDGDIREIGGAKEREINYKVTANGTYTFKIIDTNGNETLKDIIIDKFDTEDAIVENQEIGVSTQYKLKVKAKDELSGLKRITVVATIKNDSGTEKTETKTAYLSGEYQKEEEIDLGLNYNYTLTAYTIEVEDQVGNVKTYESTVELPITNTIYRISTEDEFIYFRKLLSSNYFANQTVYLENDIVLTKVLDALSNNSYFYGTFEGNNHKISGISFNNSNNKGSLFGMYNYGIIQNLNVELNIELNSYAQETAGIVEYNQGSGKIINCHSSGKIIATSYSGWYVAGLVVCNYGSIEKCSNSATINATAIHQVGGIVSINDGTIKNCYNKGNVSGNSWVGGIVGTSGPNGTNKIINCYNRGIISGASSVGGICGTGINNSSNNNYYLNTSAAGGINGADVEGKAKAKTEEEMTSDAFITLLNAGEDNWKSGADGYPTLK